MRVLGIRHFRQSRHWWARMLVAALLLPLLLGVLPQPGMSADAALARDLAWSVCDHDMGAPGEGRTRDQQRDSQCIPCTTACSICTPALATGQPAVSPSRPVARASAPWLAARSVAGARVLRAGSPTRGPPLA